MAGRSEPGPTALRIMLGAHLRRLRERAAVSRSDAGWAIRASESKISRLELGRVGFKERDVLDLLSLYGVMEAAERDRLLQLARDANHRGWWHQYGDVTPDWFDAYLGLEAAAELIRTYEIQFVPGLLQTAEYTRAVARLTPGDRSDAEVEQVVALRTSRQKVFERQPALKLWAVIEESVLRRPIGGVTVLREQLEALLAAIKRPNITLQIIPTGDSGHAATGGAFSVLRFPEPDPPDVVYLEHLTSALYLDKRDDVDAYTRILDILAVSGPPPQQAEHQLTEILAQLPRDP
ncbi:MAG TPA: helix-turn-helix transcriptional regulator [Kribbella sp.]|uniref:helix-turn-helix domain-containing protein n=1 Tax=Kribbella sp. TaxID=1871183 RepID=UPI002D774B0C|nr:helix-turn-helix transcriptional regulator [Kribbella sp.]HET6298905.1 helix-turn-helix transcriptional regulator [Kribbella sp.]